MKRYQQNHAITIASLEIGGIRPLSERVYSEKKVLRASGGKRRGVGHAGKDNRLRVGREIGTFRDSQSVATDSSQTKEPRTHRAHAKNKQDKNQMGQVRTSLGYGI